MSERMIALRFLATFPPLVAACATGSEIEGDPTPGGAYDAGATGGNGGNGGRGSGGRGSGGAPAAGGMAGATGAGVPPAAGGTPAAGGSDGAACPDPTQKRCAGLCVDPTPALGCSLDACDPCPAVTHGTATCDGATCSAECDPGFVLMGGSCAPGDGGIGSGGAGPGDSGGGTGGMGSGGTSPEGGGTVVDFGYTPSNFDPADPQIDVGGLSATRLDCGTSTFDTETLAFGNWCGQPTPAPVVTSDGAVILPFADLTIASGATLDITGNRPVIIAVYGDTIVDGTIDASADGAVPGPGGDAGCSSSAGTNATVDSGGGGGGFLTDGGEGGRGDNGNLTAAGSMRGTAELIPLIGGCPGGMGSHGAPGGAGGGAIQLSTAGELVVVGAIRADGGTGADYEGNNEGGGGGGSGGAILLEGQSVATPGSITANGGDGGDGDSSRGGSGGTQNRRPENGGSDLTDGGGGGGGSAGRIRINSMT